MGRQKALHSLTHWPIQPLLQTQSPVAEQRPLSSQSAGPSQKPCSSPFADVRSSNHALWVVVGVAGTVAQAMVPA